jgi:hypothetical protein
VSQCVKFIERNQAMYDFNTVEMQKCFIVDYKFIMSDEDELCTEWGDLKSEIIDNTEFCLDCMGLAMHQCIINDFNKKQKDSEEGTLQKKNLGIVRARLINHEPIQQIKDVRVNCYGWFMIFARLFLLWG